MKLRHTLPLLAALLLAPAPAVAAEAGAPKVHQPVVTPDRTSTAFTVQTFYSLPSGDAAKLVYTIKRHRLDRAGFKTVGTVTHIVGAGDGVDQATVRWTAVGGMMPGVGFKVFPLLVDVSSAMSDTAHAGRIKL